MSENKSNNKLKINIIASSVYQVFVLIVPILTTPYVTRIFSVEQMGEYSLSLTMGALFVVVAQFGLANYGSREIAIAKNKIEISSKFFYLESMQIITSLISFIAFNLLFLVILDYPNKILFFTQSLLIITNIFDISWFYIGIEEIDKVIIRNGITKILTTFCVLFFIKNNDQLVQYALINVTGMFLGNLSMVIQSKKYINYSDAFFKINKSNLKGSFTLLVPVLTNTSFDSAEKTLLSVQTSSENVGLYSESKKIINLVVAVIYSAFNALSPRMSHFVSTGEEAKMKNYFDRGVIISLFFSIVIVSGIINVSDDFVTFFYGSGYQMVAEVLKVSSISLTVMPITALINRGLLIPLGKDREYTISIIIILIVGIVFNVILDNKFGAVGAATAFCLSQFASFFYVLHICRNLVNSKSLIIKFIISIILIVINLFVMNYFMKDIQISNDILSFVIRGFLSVIVSLVLVFPIYLYRKFKYIKK